MDIYTVDCMCWKNMEIWSSIWFGELNVWSKFNKLFLIIYDVIYLNFLFEFRPSKNDLKLLKIEAAIGKKKPFTENSHDRVSLDIELYLIQATVH